MSRTKECTKCGASKSFTDFSKHRLGKDGYAYQCKECNATRARKWRKTPSGVYTNLKGQAQFWQDKPFHLEKEAFIEWHNSQPKKCIYCDIPEELVMIMHDYFGVTAFRLTDDCKDNDRGYYLDNIVLSCANCNRMKGNMLTFEEMRYVGQNFVKPKWQEISERAIKEVE